MFDASDITSHLPQQSSRFEIRTRRTRCCAPKSTAHHGRVSPSSVCVQDPAVKHPSVLPSTALFPSPGMCNVLWCAGLYSAMLMFAKKVNKKKNSNVLCQLDIDHYNGLHSNGYRCGHDQSETGVFGFILINSSSHST